MRVAVVLHFDVETPGYVADLLKIIDPPNLMGFAGTANIVVDPHYEELKNWLDEDDAPQD